MKATSDGHRGGFFCPVRMTVIVSLIVLALTATHAEGAEPPVKRNAISISSFGALGVIDALSFFAQSEGNSQNSSFPVTVTYQRLIADHFALAASLGYMHLLDSAGEGVGDSFIPWLELDWHPFVVGLKGLFVGVATSAEADFIYGEPLFFLYDGLGLTLGLEGMLGHHWFMKIEGGGTDGEFFLSPDATCSGQTCVGLAIWVGLGIGFEF